MSSVCRKTGWPPAAKTYRDQNLFVGRRSAREGFPFRGLIEDVGRGENCLPFFEIHRFSTRSHGEGAYDGGYENLLR